MSNKVQRVERHIIRKGRYNYQEIQTVCHLSKNLYNYVNYILRQSFFEIGSILSGIVINADVNGAIGIMRKVFSESARQIVDSGVAFTPVIIQPISYTGAKAQCNCIRIENTKKAS